MNLGGDYTLYDEQNKPIGYLDGAVFTIGGRWKGACARRTPIA